GSGTGATVVGDAASNTVSAGSGGLFYAAGVAGNTTAIGASGVGQATLLGGAGAALTYQSSLIGAVMVAGAGNETLNAALSTQNDVIWGGQFSTSTLLGEAGS